MPGLRTEVVVVGGGLVGLCCALSLHEQGVDVALVEKGNLGGESSGRALGWVSALMQHPAKLALCAAGKSGWAALQRRHGDLGLRQDGITLIAETDAELQQLAAWCEQVRDIDGTDAVMLACADLARRFPGARGRWAGAVCSTSDSVIEPGLACRVLAEALRTRGIPLLTRCAARGVEVSAGRVSGLATETHPLRASAVVVAANQWSPLLCGTVGVAVPQLYMIESLGRTSVIPEGPAGGGGRHAWGWSRCADGRYTIGRRTDLRAPVTPDTVRWLREFLPALRAEWRSLRPSFGPEARRHWRRPRRWHLHEPSPFESERTFRPKIDHCSVDAALTGLREQFPAFVTARIEEYWAGAITITPDGLPIASPVRRIPGLYVATGSTYGLTWAPAIGRLMASLVTDRATDLDPRPYRLERFGDGSRLEWLH